MKRQWLKWENKTNLVQWHFDALGESKSFFGIAIGVIIGVGMMLMAIAKLWRRKVSLMIRTCIRSSPGRVRIAFSWRVQIPFEGSLSSTPT